MNLVGALSKENRKKHRLSQFEVEERTNISRFRLSQIENGRGVSPTITEAAQLAELYHDVRIIKATCGTCHIHQTLFSIVSQFMPAINPYSDLTMVSELFVSSISACCNRIKDVTRHVDTAAAVREDRLLVIEEAKRIRFLADALELLAEQVG